MLRPLALAIFVILPTIAQGGVIFGLSSGLNGGSRWDAGPRNVDGLERSLQGGLRFSLQGGSYQAFRDLFKWHNDEPPSVSEFQSAVDQAFNAWASVDPVSGLGSNLSFVSDFGTTVVGTPEFGGLDIRGAEIDVFGVDAGDNRRRGVASFNATSGPVTLTSGTAGYNGYAIIGADVYINANEDAVWDLDVFRRLLTHELGHAIGLGDVEDFHGLGFIDDNYSAADPVGTLNNSWAGLVNALNPAASAGLTRFAAGTVANGNPGLDTPGVNILMESEGLGIADGNLVTSLVPLQNDDYGTRQFLYPFLQQQNVVPEPGSMAIMAILFSGGILGQRRRRCS